jgi:hypothetical protein
LEPWLDRPWVSLKGRHRHDLNLDQIASESRPLLQYARMSACRQLEAAVEIGLDPAIDIAQSVGQRWALLPRW